MKIPVLVILSCLCNYLVFPQSSKYKKFKFEWPDHKPHSIPLEQQFKNEDAVILSEECTYNATGNQVPSYSYINRVANYFYIDQSTQGLSPVVKEHLRIKFLTTAGIKKYSRIVLPQSFDPTGDLNSVHLSQRDSVYRPKGEFECIQYFAARIIKPDGSIVKAILNERTQEEISRVNGNDQRLYSWEFRILNLSVDDELEIYYAYDGAYNIDPSSCIFFHGVLPKQNYYLTFRYLSRRNFIQTYHNGAEPDDSVMITQDRPSNTEYHFRRKNLAGGILESGARPYRQLPYFTFYEHRNDYGIQDNKTGFVTKPLPYPWSYSLLSYVNFQMDNLKLRLKRKDLTTTALNKFVAEERRKCEDTSFVKIMSSIQHTLASEFEFKKDLVSYQSGNDNELEHLGKYIEKKTLREISRIRIYNEILFRFDRSYFRVPLFDKRITGMDILQYEPLTSMTTSFAIPHSNRLVFLYPKAYRFGYEANELPFYYEDINAILIPQNEPSEKRRDLVPDVNFIFVKTPFSTSADNIRNTTSNVTVSLDSLALVLNVRQKLSGQFSTLIRGYYLYSEVDTTVNPNYYNSVHDLSDGGDKSNLAVTNTSIEYPYQATVNMNFTNHQNIKKEGPDKYSISLDGFFCHVTDDKFTSVNRHLDFYTDFRYRDSYKYLLKFDRSVSLENTDSLQANIANSFAAVTFKTTQVGDDAILLETDCVVNTEFVPSSRAKDIDDVFNLIRSLDKKALVILPR